MAKPPTRHVSCRWCGERLVACPQTRHNCRDGTIHISDGTHECGLLQYLIRSGYSLTKTPPKALYTAYATKARERVEFDG